MKRILTVFLLTGAAWAANWPTFRGPNGSGVAEGSAPTKWDVTTSRKHPFGRRRFRGLPTPVRSFGGGKVFVTTAISSDPKAVFRHGLYGDVEPSTDVSKHVWKVYCLDRDSGKIVWSKSRMKELRKRSAIQSRARHLRPPPPMASTWSRSLDPKDCTPTT